MNTEKQLTSKFLDEYLSSCLLVLKILKEATPSNTTQQSTLLLLLNNEKQRCIERYSELYDVANGIVSRSDFNLFLHFNKERISPNTDGTEIENTLEKQRDELRKVKSNRYNFL